LLLACGVAALALVGASVAFFYNQRLQDKNVLLKEALDRSDVEKYFRHIGEASNGLRTGNMAKVARLLDECPVGPRHWEWHYLQRQCHADLLTLPGYTGNVSLSVAFSLDGRWLAASGNGHELTVWDRTTGLKHFRHLPGPGYPPWGLAFSADSRLLAWGGPNKELPSGARVCTVHVWDVTSGELVRELDSNSLIRLGKLAFSPDGMRIAAGISEAPAIVWDLKTGRILHTLHPDHAGQGAAFAVAFSPVGQQLAVGWADGTVEVWDLSTDKATLTLTGKNATIHDLAFSPDGGHLAVACLDRTVRVWDVIARRELRALTGHTGWVDGVAFSPDGRRLASAGADGTVRLWDATSGREVRTFRGHALGVGSVAFSPDGRHIASAGSDQTVKVWDTTLAQEALPLQQRNSDSRLATFDSAKSFMGGEKSVRYSPDGKRLATVDGANVKIWDVASRQVIHTLVGHTALVTDFSFSRNGKRLASASRDNTVKVWDLETPECIRDLIGHTKVVSCVAFDEDGTRLVSSGQDGCVKVWDLKPERATSKDLLHFDAWINSVAISPDGKWLVVGGGGPDPKSYVTPWDTTTWGQVSRVFEGHTLPVYGVAISADGKRLATASQDQTVRIWEVATGRSLHTLKGHSGTVFRVAFSKDGRRLASAGYGPMRIWDTIRGEEVLVLDNQEGFRSLDFSPDGHWLATAHHDGTLNLWDGRPWDDGAAAELAAEREASGLLDSLYALPLSQKDVRDYLHTFAPIRPRSRPLALDLVERYREEADPGRYFQASWAVVRQPYFNTFQYRYALRQAQTACERAPENGRYLTALGAAQYRVGEYEDALTTLKKRGNDTPEVLAFLAMAQHRVYQHPDAQTTLEQLRQTMKKTEWATNTEAQGFAREAEALLRGAAPAPKQ
jgi:WD40 repeat protein